MTQPMLNGVKIYESATTVCVDGPDVTLERG